MRRASTTWQQRTLTLLTCLLISKVVIAVLLSYRDYFPANFESDFLRDREVYFFGSYQWAFYAHITSGPLSLVLGMLLISDRMRRRFPKQHRTLGRTQTANVLLLVAPSGLWMAQRAESGVVAGLGFGMLAIATGVSIVFGWRMAVYRKYEQHRQWMERCFALLCSAVVLRFIGGLATTANIDWRWLYPISAWACWMLPLMGYELYQLINQSNQQG